LPVRTTAVDYTLVYCSPPNASNTSTKQGDEQFIRERVLETAARILGNLQKSWLIILYQQLQDWKKEAHIL